MTGAREAGAREAGGPQGGTALRVTVAGLAGVAAAIAADPPDRVVSLLCDAEWPPGRPRRAGRPGRAGRRAAPGPWGDLPRTALRVVDTGARDVACEGWADLGPWAAPAMPRHVAALLAAGRAGGHVLVHCHAGMSRGPAAALLLLAQQDGPAWEARSYRRLMAACPDGVWLTARIVALGDAALRRDGRLLAVWRAALALHARRAEGGPVTAADVAGACGT